MYKIVKSYLYILPFFSLVGIILGVLRTAFQTSYIEYFLLIGALFDLLIIVFGYKVLFTKTVFLLICLLVFSLVVGLLNNDLSRRFITDFTNPFFFFGKILVFKAYWRKQDFLKYTKYYSRVAFTGSLILLPITYFLFSSAGATRLAIFPPMELPFSYYLVNNSPLLFITMGIILLYGKRAQLVSAIFTFSIYLFFFRKDKIRVYLFILLLSIGPIIYIFSSFSGNLAIQRLNSTIDLYFEEDAGENNLNRITAGRLDEFNTITESMNISDYIIGKGIGFTYVKNLKDGEVEATNAHFSPLGFISKYGLLFTIFIYYYLGKIIFNRDKRFLKDKKYLLAVGVCFFIFFESFFAYAIFVTPIFSVTLGVLLAQKSILLKSTSKDKLIGNIN
jgi:hypothetical protein